MITKEQRILLEEAENYCDKNDKSTEFMIQYMQDTAKVSLDKVLEYLAEKVPSEEDYYELDND